MSSIRFFLFFTLSLFSIYSYGTTQDEQKLKSPPIPLDKSSDLKELDLNKYNLDTLNLHNQPRWLKLVHYKVDGDSQESIVDDNNFFLSHIGKTSPKDELLATLQAALQQTKYGSEVRCKFPARMKFLEEQLNVSLKKSSDSCTDFNNWYQHNPVDEAWLIFPSAYLNSPSSMFGHTLLRLDKRDEKGTSLTSTAVSYAAVVDDQENGLTFAFKGIFGGYPGYFSIQPYYKKVKEYGHIENRDIWEYKLNLTEEEMEWLVLHLWEIYDMRFDYYFTTQNCSYQLLALLDVARPKENLTSTFETFAIPVDTVRELKNQGWIEHSIFRASKSTEFYDYVANLNSQKQYHIASIKNHKITDFMDAIDHYNTSEKIEIVSAAYKLLRLDKQSKTSSRKALRLLSHRSRLGKAKPTISLPSPRIRPENGHEGSRLSFGSISNNNDTGLFLDYKITYHGLDDPLDGYAKGAHINFLHAQANVFDDKLELERFDIVDIRSISTSDKFIDRLAWQVNSGWERKLFNNKQRSTVRQFNAQVGKAYNLGIFNWFTLIGGHLEYSDQYKDHYQAGPNISTGIIYQAETYSTEFSIAKEYFINENSYRNHFIWSNTWRYTKNIAFNAELKSESYEDANVEKESSYNTLSLKSSFFF